MTSTSFQNIIEIIKALGGIVGGIVTPALIVWIKQRLEKKVDAVDTKVAVVENKLHSVDSSTSQKLTEIHAQGNSARGDSLRVIMLMAQELAEAKPSPAAHRIAAEAKLAYENHQNASLAAEGLKNAFEAGARSVAEKVS